jgi:hypothetical protein
MLLTIAGIIERKITKADESLIGNLVTTHPNIEYKGDLPVTSKLTDSYNREKHLSPILTIDTSNGEEINNTIAYTKNNNISIIYFLTNSIIYLSYGSKSTFGFTAVTIYS